LERLTSAHARGPERRKWFGWAGLSVGLCAVSFSLARWGALPADSPGARVQPAARAEIVAPVAASAPAPEVATDSVATDSVATDSVATDSVVEAPKPAMPERVEPALDREALASGADSERVLAQTRPFDQDLLHDLDRVRGLLGRGATNDSRALELARKLGEAYPENPEVLELWSKAAARVKWWGESLRIAIRWAAVEQSEPAALHLAKTQRLVGQRYGAILTLERFLQLQPRSEPAQEALAQYRGER
jgi:hypothetical protein